MPVDFVPEQFKQELRETARAIVAPGKGILAADESEGTIGKKFSKINVENTPENRRAYRELLFTASPELSKYLSAVILHEETLHQSSSAGEAFPTILAKQGIIPGVKVDKGTVDLSGTVGELATQGLDGLKERCEGYKKAGARFTKWRAVLKIGPSQPSTLAIETNAALLARYAAIAQSCGLVPIVEPEVLMDGDHDIERSEEVTGKVLSTVFKALRDYGVYLEGALLKPNMVLPGTSSGTPNNPTTTAEATLRTLLRIVPPALPGIAFLSGGQPPTTATANLRAINILKRRTPQAVWALTFSFGRALQDETVTVWGGKGDKVDEAKR
ncbi:hypothetical protein HK104_007671, partial [Borealophlyctis nickersoniae]